MITLACSVCGSHYQVGNSEYRMWCSVGCQYADIRTVCTYCEGQCCCDSKGNKQKHTMFKEYHYHDCDYCEDGYEYTKSEQFSSDVET